MEEKERSDFALFLACHWCMQLSDLHMHMHITSQNSLSLGNKILHGHKMLQGGGMCGGEDRKDAQSL